MPARYYSNARYQYRDENGVNKVGQLTGNFTAAQVQQLFAQAKIGDVIQKYNSFFWSAYHDFYRTDFKRNYSIRL